MNDELGPAEQLRCAARLIERAVAQLDLTSEKCGCCGARQFKDKTHATVARSLENTPSTLLRQALLLDGSPEALAARRKRRVLDRSIKQARA